ncbi:epimerase [archaeon SCG-AAA382B04]|nr:epimerase [archaeon SCG-AAA382B04]
MTETILVTGACGFIGSNLTEYLLDKTDWKIIAYDNLSNGKKEYLPKSDRVELIEADIRDKKDVREAVKGCDFVVNLAAQVGVIPSIDDPREDAEINIMGLLNLLEASRDLGVSRFVHASSAAPVGEVDEMPISEEKVPEPLSPYGASKLAGEAYCSAFASSYDIKTTALRFSNVYGPKSVHKTSVIHKFIREVLDGEEVVVYGDGNQTRDFIHVDDICQGILKSLDLENDYELIQLGTSEETTINQLYNQIKQTMTEKGVDVPEPNYKEAREGEIYKNYTDITKARKKLDFEPTVSLKKGLQKVVNWYLENY